MNRTSCSSYLLSKLCRRNRYHGVNCTTIITKTKTPSSIALLNSGSTNTLCFSNCRSIGGDVITGSNDGGNILGTPSVTAATTIKLRTNSRNYYHSSTSFGRSTSFSSSIRLFSSTGGGSGGGDDDNDNDEGSNAGNSKTQIPEWLHKKRDEAKTHKGDNRSRGGRVGRWGQGGHGDAGVRGPAKDGRRPPPNRPRKGHPSNSSHLLDTDIPRLAARKSKTKVLHDEVASGETGKHQRKNDGALKVEATNLAAHGIGGPDVPAGIVGSTDGNIDTSFVEGEGVDLDIAMDMISDATEGNVDMFADDEFDEPSNNDPLFGSTGFGTGSSGNNQFSKDTSAGGGSGTGSSQKKTKRKKKGPKDISSKEPYFTHKKYPPGYVGLGAKDHLEHMQNDGRIVSPTNKVDPNFNLLFAEKSFPTYSYSTPEDENEHGDVNNNVSWQYVNDVIDPNTMVTYQRVLAKQLGVSLDEFQSKLEEVQEEERLRIKEQEEDDAITDPKEKKRRRKEKAKKKSETVDEDERRLNDNPYGDDWILNAPDYTDMERNCVVKASVVTHRGLVQAEDAETVKAPRWELFSTYLPHPESRREPKPWMGPLLRKSPTKEWIDSHLTFVHVQGLDPTQALFGTGEESKENDEKEDMDYFKLQVNASVNNIEHSRLISKTFAKILNVDVGRISPSSLTSAYVGFGSLIEAERLIKKYQLKPLSPKGEMEEYPVRTFSLNKIDNWQSIFGLDSIKAQEADSSDDEKAPAVVSSGNNKLAQRVSSFLKNDIDDGSSVMLITQLQMPPTTSGRKYLARHFETDSTTSNITEDDIMILSPTSALIKFSSSDAVDEMIKSQTLNEVLQRTKTSLLPAKSTAELPKRRRVLTLLKAQREHVFDKYYGPRRDFESLKQGYNLVMEGDAPPDEFFKSHFDVIRIDNIPSNVTSKDLSMFIQPYVGEVHDSVSSVQIPSVSVAGGGGGKSDRSNQRTYKQNLGHAFIGFDRRFEAKKILEHWSTLSKDEKMIAFGNKRDDDSVMVPQMELVRQKQLQRASDTDSGQIVTPRSERYEDELLDDLNNWEQHVQNKQDLIDIEAFGIDKDILTQVFRKMRYQNRSFGVIDQDRRCDKLESNRNPGSRYAEFVNLYVHVLRNCITTPKYPGPMIEGLTYPDEEIDLEKWDGPRVWPDNWEDFKPVYDFLAEDDNLLYDPKTGEYEL